MMKLNTVDVSFTSPGYRLYNIVDSIIIISIVKSYNI